MVGGWVVQLTTLSLPTRVEVELGCDNLVVSLLTVALDLVATLTEFETSWTTLDGSTLLLESL